MFEKLCGVGQLEIPGIDPRFTPPILPQRIIREISWVSKRDQQPRTIVLKTGYKIHFGSVEQGREKFQGTQFDWVWIDEDMPSRGLYEELERGLLRAEGLLWWTATPLANTELLYDIHEDAESGLADMQTAEFVISLLDNPYIPEASKLEWIRKTPENMIKVRVHGQFLVDVGRKFKEVGAAHFINRQEFGEVPNSWPRWLVMDPGFDDPFGILWVAIDPMGDAIAYREYYERGQTPDSIADHVVSVSGGEPFYAFLIDPDSQKKTVANQGMSLRMQLKLAFEKRGFKSRHTNSWSQLANNDRNAGYMELHNWLKVRSNHTPKFRIMHEIGRAHV